MPFFTAFRIKGGDIFIHAKSKNYGNLWQLAELVMRSLPADSVDRAEDIYGWQYQDGRDLSGFIDGEAEIHTDGDDPGIPPLTSSPLLNDVIRVHLRVFCTCTVDMTCRQHYHIHQYVTMHLDL